MSPSVTVAPTGLRWDGRVHLTISGEVHPWRLDPARWDDVVDAVASLGFRMISIYVPWSVHETVDGGYDFSGNRDVERFLAVVADRGMKAVVRIGPDSGAELETSGWPRRILDDPRCQARRPNGLPYLLLTATGHAFPPSYASAVFRGEVRRWYEAVVPRLAALQHPDGPVVACQIDNELGYHFQPNTYALDYHPDAVQQFGAWLGDATAEPPRDASDGTESLRLAWVEWREHHRRETLATFAGWARELGMDRVPLLHNDYPRLNTPMDLGALERDGVVDWATADVYSTRQGGRFVRDLVRHLAGSSALPFLAELGAGWLALPWLLPVETSACDEEVVALRGLMSGARGANVYMLVERDRWYGSPITAEGEPRPDRAALYPRVHSLLDRIGWHTLTRDAPVLLLENRWEHRRIATRDTLGGVVPCFSQLLPLDPRLGRLPDSTSAELQRWETELAATLDTAGVDFDRATATAMPDLARYRVVVVPTFDVFDPEGWATLLEAAAGGVRVCVGPRLPSLDGRARPHPFDPGALTLLGEPGAIAAFLPAAAFRCDHPAVDVTVWHDGARSVIAAFNSSAEEVVTRLGFDGPRKLEGAWRVEQLEGDASVGIELPPWGAQVWEAR